MGKLIKNHWARLIILTASAYQLLASIEAFFWPKVFWDFLTTNLNGAVRPIPYLQILNLLFAILGLCWEWPLPLFTTAAERGYFLASEQRRAEASPSSSNNSNNNKTRPTLQVSRWTKFLASMHRSIEARLMIYPLSSLAALLLYQGTNAGLYYIIGMGVYFWGFTEGEIVMGKPWQLPRASRRVYVV
ncbi:hypothetical protein N7G274_005338 [Stereocaulon virgatum]|uniref:DUF7727 domain-containing protein n=1 Tax=Stereocaulon virgatum TaxID=373712 RepID=A0ABR4AAN5_9LECA